MPQPYTRAQLEGARLHMLLTIRLRGTYYYFSTDPVDVQNSGTPGYPTLLRFTGGLEPLEYQGAVEPFEGGELEQSVEVEVRFADDQADGFAAIVARDNDAGDATAELSQWREGDDWEDRERLLEGPIDVPEYGTRFEPLKISIVVSSTTNQRTLPPTGSEIDHTTWQVRGGYIYDEALTGEVYPIVFGTPGYFRGSDPAWFAQNTTAPFAGWPALLVEINSATDNNWTGAPPREARVLVGFGDLSAIDPGNNWVEIMNVTTGLWGSFETFLTQDAEGRNVTAMDVPGLGVPPILRISKGDQLWARSVDRGHGGIWNEKRTGPMTGAGDIAAYLMSWSGIRFDLEGSREALKMANAWQLDFHWNAYRSAWAVIEDEILPLMPMGWEMSHRGLRFIWWDLEATASRATFEVNPALYGGERRGNVQRGSALEVRNEFRLDYWAEPISGKTLRYLTVGPSPKRASSETHYELDPFAQASATRYHDPGGDRSRPAEPQTSEAIQDPATARATLGYWVRRHGYTAEDVSYLLPQPYQAIRSGAIGVITDSRLGWTDRVVLAYRPIRAPGDTILSFRTVPDFNRDSPV